MSIAGISTRYSSMSTCRTWRCSPASIEYCSPVRISSIEYCAPLASAYRYSLVQCLAHLPHEAVLAAVGRHNLPRVGHVRGEHDHLVPAHTCNDTGFETSPRPGSRGSDRLAPARASSPRVPSARLVRASLLRRSCTADIAASSLPARRIFRVHMHVRRARGRAPR